ncbi:MAG: DUF1887 family CARF protein [bacterium]
MKKILVSLVSDQAIPNLLMIKELTEIDSYLFISTKAMEDKNKSENLINAAQINNMNLCKTIRVNQNSFSDIQSELKKLDFDDDDQFFVNITGGNKMMALSVYEYFRQRKNQVFYIPIRENSYMTIFPQDKTGETPINYRLTIDEYLKSYGINYNSERREITPSYQTEQFFEYYKSNYEDLKPYLNILRKSRNKKNIKQSDHPKLFEFIKTTPFKPQKNDSLSKYEIRYLSGEWLEEFIYNKINNWKEFGNEYLKQNVYIEIKGANNQFDVIAMLDNTLYLFECKTGVYDSTTNKNILGETLYKISALKQSFGLTPKSRIITLSQKDISIIDHHLKRANALDIEIFDRSMLINDFKAESLFES